MHESHVARALAEALILACPRQPDDRQRVSCLKDLLYQIPDLSEADWPQLDGLLDDPALHAEAPRVFQQLRAAVASDDSRDHAIYSLERMFLPLPQLVFGEMEAKALVDLARQGTDVEIREGFGAILEDALTISLQTTENLPAAVEDLRELVTARTHDWATGDLALELPEAQMQKLCLEGILIARIAFADAKVDARERELSEDFLRERWQLAAAQAAFVLEVSLGDSEDDIDFLRVCRWYFELTSARERYQFMELLFQLAVSDEDLSDPETNELMNIAANLRLEQEDFHELFLRYGGVETNPLLEDVSS